MSIYDDTVPPTASTADIVSGSTNPSPAAAGGTTSYWYSNSTAGGGALSYQKYALDGQTAWRLRMLVYVTATQTGDASLIVNRYNNDSATGITLRINGAGMLRIAPAGGTPFAWTSTTAFPLNGWYRLEAYGDAAAGNARVALFNLGSATPISGIDSGLTSVSQGGIAPSHVRVGTTPQVGRILWDLFDYRTGADAPQGFIGPYNSVAPSVSVPLSQSVAAGATVQVTATATGSGPFTFAWSTVLAQSSANPTLTGATTSQVSFPAPAAGNLVTLQCVATDANNLSTTVFSEVRVPTDGATDTAPIISGAVVGTWNNVGGAASLAAALADASDATYGESGPVSTTAQTHRERYGPGASRSSLTLTRRLDMSAGTGTATLRLYQGGTTAVGSGTLIATWTQTGVTTTSTDYPFTATSAQVSAITDWGALWTELDATA